MRPTILLVVLVVTPTIWAGDEQAYPLARERFAILWETFAVLKTVKDKSTAEAARPKLETLGQRHAVLQKRLKKVRAEDFERMMKPWKELEKSLTSVFGAFYDDLSGPPSAIGPIADVFPFAEITKTRLEAARRGVAVLSKAVAAYRRKTGKFPLSLEQLAQKIGDDGPFVQGREALIDPWGYPYLYDPTGSRNNGKQADIWSQGVPGRTRVGNWPAGAQNSELAK
jgi:hypothetical protein